MFPHPENRAIPIERVAPRESLRVHQVVGLGDGFKLVTRCSITRHIDRGEHASIINPLFTGDGQSV